MECEMSFILIKLVRLDYLVFALGNRTMKPCIKNDLRLAVEEKKNYDNFRPTTTCSDDN